MSLRTQFAVFALVGGTLAQAANVAVVRFNPSEEERKAAASRPMPKTQAEQTAASLNQSGVNVPGQSTVDTGRTLIGFGKSLNTPLGSRVILAEITQQKFSTNNPVFVGFGSPEQLGVVENGLKSTNFSGNVTFITVDDTKRPLKGDFKSIHETHDSAGTPLVLAYTTDGAAVAFAVNASDFKTDEGQKAIAARLPAANVVVVTNAPAAEQGATNAAPVTTGVTNVTGAVDQATNAAGALRRPAADATGAARRRAPAVPTVPAVPTLPGPQ